MIIRGALIAAAGFVLLSPLPASAQGMGLAGIHEWVRVGGKICMKDHYHDGASAGEKTKKAAEAAAISAWQGFTAWEYGGAWGAFRNAESKSVKCSGGGSSWGCQVSARPCRHR
jgi:hypothetical protein